MNQMLAAAETSALATMEPDQLVDPGPISKTGGGAGGGDNKFDQLNEKSAAVSVPVKFVSLT